MNGNSTERYPNGFPLRRGQTAFVSSLFQVGLLILSLGSLQGCIIWPYAFDSGLERENPVISKEGVVTLRWEAEVGRVLSRLPGGTRFHGGWEFRDAKIEDLRYDVQVFQEVKPTPVPDMGDSNLQREVVFKLIHYKQGLRETQYTLPQNLARGATYAWRVRPVYRHEGRTVAEDWTRDNSGWFFAVVGPGGGGDSMTTTTRPPEFKLP